ncbi:MAG: hypothetical protein QOC94_2513 [Actinoplanes sp.]|jgi:hypothetical protein|nr:hypothetical protein [Actinoplanes sp.]
MTDPAAGEPMADYFLLTDPEWEESEDAGQPPREAVIGRWPVDEHGVVGLFRSNPDYRPRYGSSPSDPIDVLLRLAMQGDVPMEQLQLILRDSMFDLALNGDGRPLIVRSPDGVPCAVVTTSGPHRERVQSPDWTRIAVAELAQRLSDGVDVLINPNGPSTVRLAGSFVQETVLMTDEDVATAYAEIRAEATPD